MYQRVAEKNQGEQVGELVLRARGVFLPGDIDNRLAVSQGFDESGRNFFLWVFGGDIRIISGNSMNGMLTIPA